MASVDPIRVPVKLTAALTLIEFQQAASRTLPELCANHFFECSQTQEVPAFFRNVDLIHALFGLSGEVGELIDPVKKAMFYGKPLDVENIKEEAGDLLWYIAAPLCRALGCTFEELAMLNVAKLSKRYPEKYSDEAATKRADKQIPLGAPHGKQLRSLSAADKIAIREKYAPQQIDFSDGYFWNAEDKFWDHCPECWEDIPVTLTLGEAVEAVTREVETAMSPARALVEHLKRLGVPMTEVPVEFEGVEYVVTVAPKKY